MECECLATELAPTALPTYEWGMSNQKKSRFGRHATPLPVVSLVNTGDLSRVSFRRMLQGFAKPVNRFSV